MGADEIEHRTERLATGASKASPELLDKQCRAFRWAEYQDRVDDGTSTPSLKRSTENTTWRCPVARSLSAFLRSVSGCHPIWPRLDTMLREVPSHELSMFDADAESEGAHDCRVIDVSSHLLDDQPCPGWEAV